MRRAPVLIAVLLLASSAPQAAEPHLTGDIAVIDGDTIEIAGTRVRLDSVDAPELGQECRIAERTYDCGMVARTALLDLTAGARVVCAMAGPPTTGGEEGRPGRCWADGYDLSEGMVYTGWAVADAAAPGRYALLQQGARTNARGLWKGRFLAPERWRAGARLEEAPSGR